MSVNTLIRKAQAYFKRGHYSSAQEIYESILTEFPKNRKAQEGLARIKLTMDNQSENQLFQKKFKEIVEHFHLNEFELAASKAKILCKKFPNRFELLNLLGAAAARSGDTEQAINAFEKTVECARNKAEAYYNLGTAYRDHGKLDDAVSAYKNAIMLQENYPIALNNLGTILKDQNKFDEAVEMYHMAISCNPEYAKAYNNLGVALLAQGNFESAASSFQTAIDKQSNYAEAHYNLGVTFQAIGSTEDALKTFETAISLKSDYVQAYLNLGNLLQTEGEIDQATEAFDAAISINPRYAEAYFNKGNIFLKQCDFHNATSLYNQAISLRSNYFEAYNNLGYVHTLAGDFTSAISAYENAIKIKPDYAEAIDNLASVYKELGEFNQALEYYKQALRWNPDYGTAYYNMGITFRAQNKFNDAEECFRGALELEPDNHAVHNYLGLVLADQNLFEEAMYFYKTAISLKNDFSDAHNNLGVALKQRGDMEEAYNCFDRALSFDPDHFEARNNLGGILVDIGRPDLAVDAYKDALSVEPNNAGANYNLGRLNWLQNNFESAFELMEWRWQGDPNFINDQFDGNRPTWDGDASEAVFVWREQGIGDEIMFGSMLPALHAISSKVILECDQRLIPIYERSFPEGIRFVSHRNQVSEDEYTSHIAVGSLLKHFRRKLEDFSSVSPGWLKAEPKKIASLRERLRSKASDKVIGISWQTNATGTKSYQRNIPLDILAKYLKPVQAKFVNLQYDSTTDVLLNAEKSTGLKIDNIDEIDIYNDIDGLAALISACDIVVSIDNSTVHLAGALGIDTRVLLPEVADERWGLDSSDSYWYDHLTLYRQISKDDWSNPLECLVQDLNQELS